MFPELKRLIEQMGKDRGIDREIIVKALEDAMLTAARKKLGPDVELEARYNEEAGEIEVFQFKTVMEKILDPETQVSLAEARRSLDEEAEPGDSLGIKIAQSNHAHIVPLLEGVEVARPVALNTYHRDVRSVAPLLTSYRSSWKCRSPAS